jgi:hypothetical protein
MEEERAEKEGSKGNQGSCCIHQDKGTKVPPGKTKKVTKSENKSAPNLGMPAKSVDPK